MTKYLRSEEFLPHAPKNEGTININHKGCPAGEDRKQRLYITRKRDGSVVAYCHHCTESGFQSISKLGRARGSVSSTLRSLEDDDHTQGGTGSAPPPRKSVQYPREATFPCSEWPKEVRDWYNQYEITDEEATSYGFSYVPSGYYCGRLVLPCWSGGILKGYQLRNVNGASGPKYYSVFATADGIRRTFDSTEKSPRASVGIVSGSVDYSSTPLVLVEDVLSAIKVGRVARGVACLTSTLDTDTLMSLRSQGHDECVIWLDNDNVDVNRKARALHRQASLLFPRTRFVTGYADPKHYTMSEIGEILYGRSS